jgi:predicted  nucleic acid-binding Zn-ribbon protein
MSPKNNADILEITNIVQATIQTAITPLSNKIQSLDDKVNALALDRATRSDIEKLRAELVGTMVPRDAYNPQHAMLIERDAQLEAAMRDMRRDLQEDLKNMQAQHQIEMQRVHDRLESGKQQFEKRMDDIEDKMEDAKQAELSTKDRWWVRASIFSGFIAVVVALLEFLLVHVHFN